MLDYVEEMKKIASGYATLKLALPDNVEPMITPEDTQVPIRVPIEAFLLRIACNIWCQVQEINKHTAHGDGRPSGMMMMPAGSFTAFRLPMQAAGEPNPEAPAAAVEDQPQLQNISPPPEFLQNVMHQMQRFMAMEQQQQQNQATPEPDSTSDTPPEEPPAPTAVPK